MLKPRAHLLGALALGAICALPAPAIAADAECRTIASNTERLACYDRAAPPVSAPPAAAPAHEAQSERGLKDRLSTFVSGEHDRELAQGSTLGDNWELDSASKRGRFVLRPYKPMFVLPVSHTDHVNQSPSSLAGSKPPMSVVELRTTQV